LEYHNGGNNSHHREKTGNKSIQHEKKRNGDVLHPYVVLHTEIELTNHREVRNGTQNTH